jgi:hypothetical protein
MDRDLVKRRQRELSKQQAVYVAHRERGLPRQKSAILAGYADVDKAGEQVEQSEVVQRELEKARTSLVAATGITKEDVAQGLKEAADMAKTMADPQAMVRAWSELGKLLGHYAPEVKKHLHGIDKETRDAIQKLSDAELLRLANGRVIDSTAVEVKDE